MFSFDKFGKLFSLSLSLSPYLSLSRTHSLTHSLTHTRNLKKTLSLHLSLVILLLLKPLNGMAIKSMFQMGFYTILDSFSKFSEQVYERRNSISSFRFYSLYYRLFYYPQMPTF